MTVRMASPDGFMFGGFAGRQFIATGGGGPAERPATRGRDVPAPTLDLFPIRKSGGTTATQPVQV
jgi:hypothetical protein